MTRWAVTGATGFMGRALLQRCADLNRVKSDSAAVPDVLGLSRRPPTPPLAGVRYASCMDLSGSVDWMPVLRGVDVVVHTAARVHIMSDTAADPLAEFRRVNVEATLNLARQAAAAGVKRLVFVSSIGVNGVDTRPSIPFTERDTCHPHNDYTWSKFEAEQGLQQVAAESGLEVAIIRPPLVYGANAPGNFGDLVRVVRRGLPLPLASVHNQRSLVAMDNVVDLVITCGTHPRAAHETFLVSDGQDLSTPELIRKMAKAAGVQARLFSVPQRVLEAGSRCLGKAGALQRLTGNLQVDISKARRVLSWVPPVSVEEGLRRAMGAGRDGRA